MKPPVYALGGNIAKYFKMTAKFELAVMNPCMKRIAGATNTQDWQELHSIVNELREASGAIGASKVHYACFYIQEAYAENDFQEMFKCYPLLVEAIIELKRYLRRFLCEYRALPYTETTSAYHTSLARGFKIEKDEPHDTYYCLVNGHTIVERKEDLEHHMYKPDIVQRQAREMSDNVGSD